MKRLLAVLALAFVVLAANTASAAPIYLHVGPSGPNVLGEAFTRLNIRGGGGALSDAAIMTNALLGMNTSTRATIDGPEYYRSPNDFGTLPAAVARRGDNTNSGFQFASNRSGDWVAITNHPYLYLVGNYDGPNGGTEVWYIGDIARTDTIYIPRYAFPTGTPRDLVDGYRRDRYEVSSFQLLNPVPDGGATVTLLGLAIAGLGLVRRLKK